MRQVDRSEDVQPLPPPIRKPVEPEPEKWTAIASQPGFERNQAGAVRKQQHLLWWGPGHE